MQVRLASEAEALEIVSEPATVQRIEKVPEHMTRQPWIIEDAGRRMMFVFWWMGDGLYEAHIAMPRRDVIASRWLTYCMLRWLFGNGARRIITNCPEGKIANLARKLGMRETARHDTTIYFEVTPWELEPQSPVAP